MFLQKNLKIVDFKMFLLRKSMKTLKISRFLKVFGKENDEKLENLDFEAPIGANDENPSELSVGDSKSSPNNFLARSIAS